jgi:hypothetical protein
MVAARNQEQENTMTDTTTTAPAARTPSHIAYQVRDREGKKGIWTRIGSVWPHADGQGFNVQLDAVPLDGRISLRVLSEKQD